MPKRAGRIRDYGRSGVPRSLPGSEKAYACHFVRPRPSTDQKPKSAERLARLRSLIDQKFSEFDAAIQARSAQGFEAAQSQIKVQQSRAAMDSIRALVSKMDSVEEQLLRERARHVEASEKRILLVGAATAAFSVGIRIYLAMRAAGS